MVAYEIHWLDEMGRDNLIGVLPERRRKPERITLRSIFGWVRKYLPDKYDTIWITPISFRKSREEEFLSNRSFRAYDNVIYASLSQDARSITYANQVARIFKKL